MPNCSVMSRIFCHHFATILFSTRQRGKSDSEKFSWHKKFYQQLKSLGWIQQRIAKAKNVDKATVSRRLRFNDMPAKVKEVVLHNLLSEWHLQELLELSVAQRLSPWLTTSQAWEELAEKAVHDRAKNGSRPVKEYQFCRHFGDKKATN